MPCPSTGRQAFDGARASLNATLCACAGRSGDDVGDQLVLDYGDLVAQAQLAPLQPRELELVDLRGHAQRGDRIARMAQEYHATRKSLSL